MKKGFRWFSLALVAFAIFGGIKSGEWFFPLWIMVLAAIVFLCTFKRAVDTVNSVSDIVD